MDMKKCEIIAVDFDGTLCENQWPEIGMPNTKLIASLKKLRTNGDAKLILWTNRVDDKLEAAVNWCKEQGLEFDAVNDNLPGIVEKFGSNCRKIYADRYIDDRADIRFDLPFGVEKSNIETWAESEVALACQHERSVSGSEEEWDYGCACYESALRAYHSLCMDGHSGFSIGLTKQILVRLIEGKPLTPIEDTEDVWSNISDISGLRGEEVNYQCKRMSSLFKYVYADGTVKYTDIERYYCKDIHTGGTYRFGIVAKIIDEMEPITMPYIPHDKPYVVYCEDFRFGGGDFDTFGVLYMNDPKGNTIQINRYFKEAEEGGMMEITADEYNERKATVEKKEDEQS